MKCSTCGEPTGNSFGVCDDCVASSTATERAAQGLPPKITDDPTSAAWLARMLLPHDTTAVAS